MDHVRRPSAKELNVSVLLAEIKTARRSISNLRYADDTTLIAESEEKLKNFLTTVKEGSKKAGL